MRVLIPNRPEDFGTDAAQIDAAEVVHFESYSLHVEH